MVTAPAPRKGRNGSRAWHAFPRGQPARRSDRPLRMGSQVFLATVMHQREGTPPIASSEVLTARSRSAPVETRGHESTLRFDAGGTKGRNLLTLGKGFASTLTFRSSGQADCPYRQGAQARPLARMATERALERYLQGRPHGRADILHPVSGPSHIPKSARSFNPGGESGEPCRIRTCDPLIKSQLLYQLS